MVHLFVQMFLPCTLHLWVCEFLFILVALESGGILELPKAFVDPRRPVPIDGKLDTR